MAWHRFGLGRLADGGGRALECERVRVTDPGSASFAPEGDDKSSHSKSACGAPAGSHPLPKHSSPVPSAIMLRCYHMDAAGFGLLRAPQLFAQRFRNAVARPSRLCGVVRRPAFQAGLPIHQQAGSPLAAQAGMPAPRNDNAGLNRHQTQHAQPQQTDTNQIL